MKFSTRLEKIMNPKLKTIVTALGLGLALSSVPSHAALISSLFVPGVNTAQDQDAERLLDTTGNVKTTGTYVVGDAIESIIRFDSVNSSTIGDSLPAPYQLTGYSKLVVSGITILVDNGPVGSSATDIVRLHFGNIGDTLVSLYERLAGNTSLAFADAPGTSITKITTQQTWIADLGLVEADDFWYADTINDASVIDLLPAGGGQVAAGVFGISQKAGGTLPIKNNGIMSPVDGNMHGVIGDASVFGLETGVNPNWQVSSNINASFTVPEPETLALLGIGLLGMGLSSRKHKAA